MNYELSVPWVHLSLIPEFLGAVVAFFCDSGAEYKCRDLLTYLLNLTRSPRLL